jgi:ATP-dependent DNA helicase UvrD/PcrA
VADIDALLKDLTPPQREAVTHVDGPLLIVAGAGSGKTRVITRRVAYLVSLGIPAASILAITFTNKAAGEMKERISKVLGRRVRDFGRLDQPWPMVCTFHSLCLRILRHYASAIGLPTGFSVYDTADQTKLIKEAIKALDLSSENFPPGNVHATISNTKNQLVSAEQFERSATDFYQRAVARIYSKYQKLLEQNNALDFDDLMLRTAQAFRDHPQVLAELQERFQYLLIDEYQDTNHAQYILSHALAMQHRNMCVVGDPDQCLIEGTLVQTPSGPLPIEEICAGDWVTSGVSDGASDNAITDRAVRRHFTGKIIVVKTADGARLAATPNHIIFAATQMTLKRGRTYLKKTCVPFFLSEDRAAETVSTPLHANRIRNEKGTHIFKKDVRPLFSLDPFVSLPPAWKFE